MDAHNNDNNDLGGIDYVGGGGGGDDGGGVGGEGNGGGVGGGGAVPEHYQPKVQITLPNLHCTSTGGAAVLGE